MSVVFLKMESLDAPEAYNQNDIEEAHRLQEEAHLIRLRLKEAQEKLAIEVHRLLDYINEKPHSN